MPRKNLTKTANKKGIIDAFPLSGSLGNLTMNRMYPYQNRSYFSNWGGATGINPIPGHIPGPMVPYSPFGPMASYHAPGSMVPYSATGPMVHNHAPAPGPMAPYSVPGHPIYSQQGMAGPYHTSGVGGGFSVPPSAFMKTLTSKIRPKKYIRRIVKKKVKKEKL